MSLSSAEVSLLREQTRSLETSGERRATRWWVLTGAPGSGKTTLAKALAGLGWVTISDPGRDEYEEQLALGVPPDDARRDYRRFQHRVIGRLRRTMATTPDEARVVFDYGLAESLAFMHLAGLAWDEETVRAAAQVAFGQVFLLDLVPLGGEMEDRIRAETMHERTLLRGLIDEVYVALGHRPVRVPLLPPGERLARVLAADGLD
jgi:predicted ATPase